MAQAIFTKGKQKALMAIFAEYNYLALGYAQDVSGSFDPNDPHSDEGQAFNELSDSVGYFRVPFGSVDDATFTNNDDNTVTMTLKADVDTTNISQQQNINQFAICKSSDTNNQELDDIYCAGNFTEFTKDNTTGLTFVIEIVL